MVAIARAVPAAEAASEQNQYLTFVLGTETFAVAIAGVKEIIEYGGLTTVPMMPPFIRGVINLRGAVVPVVDLAARFGRGISEATKRSCTVIIEVGEGDAKQDVGMMVDAVSAVLDIPAHDIEPAPSFGTHIRTDFIQGMGKVHGRFVIILNVGEVLSADEVTQLKSVDPDAEPAVDGPESAALLG